MVCGADEVALLGIAKFSYRRLTAQALSVCGLISRLLGWSEIIACETAIAREAFLESHRIVNPAAGTARQQLAIPQIDRLFQNFSFCAQLDSRWG